MVYKKRMLWRDIAGAFKKSKGRFASIVLLILLGSFALVGLKVTGPGMRTTGENYFNAYETADLTVIGDLGIDDDDVADIEKDSGIQEAEFGYLKDVTVEGSNDSVRIESKPKRISQYEVTEGRLPEEETEIALSASIAKDHPVGSTVSFREKASAQGGDVLKHHSFTVVGIVNSTEIISDVNRGATQAGTGDLTGYAVAIPSTFDVDYYMIARVNFSDTQGLDPYSDDYLNKVAAHKEGLENLLSEAPQRRLEVVKAEYDEQISDGQKEITDAENELSNAKNELDDANEQLKDAREQIAENQRKLDDAKDQLADGKRRLDSSWLELADAKKQLDGAKEELSSSEAELRKGAWSLAAGKKELASKQAEYEKNESALADAEKKAAAQISAAQKEIDESRTKLEAGKEKYESAIEQLESALAKLDNAKKSYEEGISQLEDGIEQLDQQIKAIDAQMDKADPASEEYQQLAAKKRALEEKRADTQAELDQTKAAYDRFLNVDTDLDTEGNDGGYTTVETLLSTCLKQAKAAYDSFLNVDADPDTEGNDGGYAALIAKLDVSQEELDKKASDGKKELDAKRAELDAAKNQLEAAQAAIQSKQSEYDAGKKAYESGIAQYNSGLAQYRKGLSAWREAAQTLSDKQGDYDDGLAKIEEAKAELASKQEEYEDGLAEYEKELPDALQEIADGKSDLADAKEDRDSLELPSYEVSNRREAPGSEGYQTYSNVSEIVDSLANIFPYFMYLVAALVASTTMTRMVDEERINAGTLKALGYSKRDILKKFAVYGAAAGSLGAVLGIAAGHTLIPIIVNNAYSSGFTLPPIELHFYLDISLVAFVLALIVSVVPAVITAQREISEVPAQLLLPKPPAKGSKILLEKIPFIWNKMNFTRKVTARNLLRYKKRMLMTVFGIAGAAMLMFSGFAVQHSIDGLSEKQFGDIIGYDLIVAKENHVSSSEREAIEKLLESDKVESFSTVHYEEVTKKAGSKGDDQTINLLVAQDAQDFTRYVDLRSRASQAKLELDDGGAIISERLATLTGAKVGDDFSFKDENGVERTVKVSGICEMYMEHFMVMTATTYNTCFNTTASSNAYVATLHDGSLDNTRNQAAEFMELDGVKGVAQSAALVDQIDVIVSSLNKIMLVLIVISILLAGVIVYNLVSVNVAERIRELSTIKVLGFFDKEVTMYIYRETIINAIIAIPVGWLFGYLLQQYIITAVPPENVMFDPAPGLIPFLVPIVVVALVVLTMYFVVRRRLKNVNMLEALKSVD